jgi:outer membrane receptor protein involved in Fe transport
MKWHAYLLSIALILSAFTVKSQDSSFSNLTTVIISANKLKEKRINSPVAIAVLSPKMIEETKAQRIDYLLNKVSGVYMPSIGNEQHMMAIRQPISLKGLYLFLEDGMPIRTSGLYSSNALIEINTSNIHLIEILKGPASALYGAEAIGGVVNFISTPIPSNKLLNISSQLSDGGLKKLEASYGLPTSHGGWMLNGSITDQKNGPVDYSDYSKKTISIRRDFKINTKWTGYQSLNYIDYHTQMIGSVDSIHFAQKSLSSQQTFTYRQINALRFRQNLVYQWNENSFTTINLMFRNNTMDQNPTYSIASTTNPTKFKGQVNSNHFDAYVVDLRHQWNFNSIKSKLLLGGYWDNTNQNLIAHYIDIYKDTAIGKYTKYNYPIKDSLVTSYTTQINNKAIYVNFIASLSSSLHWNMALRYDDFEYLFNNLLPYGTPTSNNHFNNWAPKLGFTYNQKNWGGYLNYSEGFVPPQITEIYNTVRVPYLLPQQFKNMEIGAWYQLPQLYTEFSIYQLNGNNEIISVRQTDGVNLNQNSGSTQHIGIEYQIKYKISNQLEWHWNASNAKHNYVHTQIKGITVDGNQMTAAPSFFSNMALYWKPNAALHASLEWLDQSSYYMDETNATKYPGFSVFNIRTGYGFKKSEIWLAILNAGNSYYSTMATKNFSVKGNAAYAYYIGDPRSITIGWKWYIIK